MLKRLFDLLFSGVAFVVLIPLILVTAILVLLNLGSPVFFSQTRAGYRGKPFKIYKFRSMKTVNDKRGALLPDIQRLTKFGAFLRSSSLDELPALWNVIKGDMSLVGPRPLLVEYLILYDKYQFRRHEVKPGITGWAQVNGRNAITWQQKFNYDIWYVDNRSLILDIIILLLTIKAVISSDGINASHEMTMEKFKGNNDVNE